jgi:hypothetical protein
MNGPLQECRPHALVDFIFAGAHAAKGDEFFIYAVVYAVYFVPWLVLRRRGKP